MAANTNPIYSRVGDIQWSTAAVLAANTTRTGDAGTIYPVFTADAANGGRVERLKFAPLGTNVVTVARVFINNGGATTTAANNVLFAEVDLAATTLSETASLLAVELAANLVLPPGYSLFVTLGTAVSAGFSVSAHGGKY